MTEEELYSETESLIEQFRLLDSVKQYKGLKKALRGDKRLNGIEADRKRLQANIKFLKNAKKDECMKICKELQIEYDNDPLVINYRESKAEIDDILSILTDSMI